MHVYLRDETITLRMQEVDSAGLNPEGSELTPVAFYVEGNQTPSFRALLPPDTVAVLREALQEPVTLGLMAEEPPDPAAEIHAMVGLAVPLGDLRPDAAAGEEEAEPWRASAGSTDAWRADADDADADSDEDVPRTALLAFAPLVRLFRRFPLDFGEELADLLESALAGSTRPALEARVDRMLGDM